MRKHKVSVPYSIIDSIPSKSFTMRLANFSTKRVHLRKGSIVGTTLKRPKFIVSLLVDPAAKQTDSTEPEGWDREVSLAHVDHGSRVRVLVLLRKYSVVCDGGLGTLKGATHRIEIIPGAKPVYQQPCRCGIERRKAEEAEVQRMLKANLIAPSTSEWASPVILVP